MKIDAREDHVLGSHGITESRAFGIRQNAHAFKMLSSGLYSDKIRAVLREIGCNATDAHVEYGTPDRPIDVKLPNRIDHQFYIKDYGPGLKHEDVMTLYATYFASTKQNSNDFTGAFGLGSKSPFSYVDSFNVVSVYGGKKRTYSAHLDNTGTPTVSLLATEDADSDWQHGVSVGFAVSPGDYQYFLEKAQTVFQWFKVMPNVIGAPAIVPVSTANIGPGFMQLDSVHDDSMGVLMGNVHYPLHVGSVEGATNVAKAAAMLRGLVLRLPIGSVRVAASREALEYDKPSMQQLNTALEGITATVVDSMKKVVSHFETAKWADKCDMRTVESKWTGSNYFNWNQFFTLAGEASGQAMAKVIGTRQIEMPDYAGKKTMFRIVEPFTATKVSYTVLRGGHTTGANYSQGYLRLREKTVIYWGSAKHSLPRVRALVLDKSVEQALFFAPRTGETEEHSEKEAKRLARDFPGIKVVHVGSLPVPPDKLSSKAGGTKTKKPKDFVKKSLPSGTTVHGLRMAGPRIIIAPMDLSGLKPEQQHFMCLAPHGALRMFNGTVENDKYTSQGEWGRKWDAFVSLQKEVSMEFTEVCPVPTALEIRRLDLDKRGWKRSPEVVRTWLESQAVRDEIAAIAGKWRPTVNLTQAISGWSGALLSMRHGERPYYDHIAPLLDQHGIHASIVDIHEASVKAGAKAGEYKPEAVILYDKLSNDFPLKPIVSVGKRSFLTVGDLETQITASFPMMSVFDVADLARVKSVSKQKLLEFMTLVLT